MQFSLIQKVLGLLLSLFSIILLPPLFFSLWLQDGAAVAFFIAFIVILFIGLLLWWPVRGVQDELRLRDGFIVVVLFWVGLGLSGAIPLAISQHPYISIVDAIFESMSGLTTTGATVMMGIDNLPPSILLYRQGLQWLGGMGVIVLAVAILPMLGIGGMQLYRAEAPGQLKDSKLTPRITETAKALWYIYLGMTIACALTYWFCGMSLFDAICHSFSTVSIGGFSTHDESIGYFNSPLIEFAVVVFMFLSGVSYTLHFLAWRSGLRYYWRDTEFKVYVGLLLSICLTCVAYRYFTVEGGFIVQVQESLFQTVSMATTTGYTIGEYYHWSGFLPVLLLLSSFVGACAGSTGGGLKVIRIVLLFKQSAREVRRLVHPHAILPIRIGDKILSDRIIEAVWGYFAAYATVFTMLMLALMVVGQDPVTAFSAVAACMNNLGPGLGDVSLHYGDISDSAKLILCLAMLFGRLEVFTLLVVLSPVFWRR